MGPVIPRVVVKDQVTQKAVEMGQQTPTVAVMDPLILMAAATDQLNRTVVGTDL